MKTIHAITVAWVAITLCVGATHGAVRIGDKPTLRFKTIDGQIITSNQIEGRIVILEFWATWCGPCIVQLPHMMKLHAEYHPKGVQLIGVSMASDHLPKVRRFVQQKKIPWPQVYDGSQTRRLASLFRVVNIPHTVILSPQGELLWQGHPARINRPLQSALKTHPPVLPSRARVQAIEWLEKANTLADQKNYAKALAMLAQVPAEMFNDAKVHRTGKTLPQKLKADGQDATQIAKALAGNPVATRKLQLLLKPTKQTQPTKGPSTRPTITTKDTSRRAQIAEKHLRRADQLRIAQKEIPAYKAYLKITNLYKGTPSADVAAQHLRTYQADGQFTAAFDKAKKSSQARALLSLARSYEAANKIAKARTIYLQVIQECPDTDCSAEANEALKRLK